MPASPPFLVSSIASSIVSLRASLPRVAAASSAALAAVLAMAGCRAPDVDRSGLFEPYRVPIPQGNYITKLDLSQVREGMTPEQVRFALGTPLVQDPFHPERWDYVFRYQRANGQATLRHATVVFREGKVARIEEAGLPERDDPNDTALPGSRAQRPLR